MPDWNVKNLMPDPVPNRMLYGDVMVPVYDLTEGKYFGYWPTEFDSDSRVVYVTAYWVDPTYS